MEREKKKSNIRYKRMLLKAKNAETKKTGDKVKTVRNHRILSYNTLNIALSIEANYIPSSARNSL